MSSPSASVIVRAKNEAASIEHTLSSLRAQSVEPEIIVVDSGSTDGTVELARRYCDHLIELRPEDFSYGHALNVGAAAARAPVHFALSAHCPLERTDWIERSLAHYERPDVAGTGGARAAPDGRSLGEVFFQRIEHARANPYWGFSNHASSWRASVWQQFSFDETLEASEDREWAWRVLEAGWVIAFDPELWVDLAHRWRVGIRDIYRRRKREARAVASFSDHARYRLGDCIREWWSEMPDDRHAALVYRLDYRRTIGLAGKYSGERAARKPR